MYWNYIGYTVKLGLVNEDAYLFYSNTLGMWVTSELTSDLYIEKSIIISKKTLIKLLTLRGLSLEGL